MVDASTPVPNPANGDINLGGNRARNAVPSLTDDNYVTRGELAGVIAAVVAASYLLRSGANPMTGNLNGGGNKAVNFANGAAAGELLTYAQAVLLAVTGVQVLAGKLRSPATVDGDDDLTLITKAWMLSKITGTALPQSGSLRFTSPGSFPNTFTVPAGITSLWAQLRSGSGGSGASSATGRTGGAGGAGNITYVRLTVTPGQQLSVIVGGGGGGGGRGGGANYSAAGGGGGGMSQIAIGGITVTVGGGGGGGAARNGGGTTDGDGGSGGVAGNNGQDGNSVGGTAGIGGTTNGGAGGASVTGTPGNAGLPGTVTLSGTGVVDNAMQDYLYNTITSAAGAAGIPSGAGAAGAGGSVIIRW
jgi:hypothetical protein